MGLHELIEEHVDSLDGDPELLAVAIFEEILSDPELLQEIVLPALRAAIRNRLRMLALTAERSSILDAKPGADPAADRLAFLAEKFFVPGVGFVTWAEASIEHHEARIAYLQSKVAGLIDTQERHQRAIIEIKKAGVKNLGEIHGKRRRTKRAS
jgi:hypothetical protein